MNYDENEARAKIAALLQLPADLAGASSASLSAALAELGKFHPSPEEFGDLTAQANTAFDTVYSALLAMRERALERER